MSSLQQLASYRSTLLALYRLFLRSTDVHIESPTARLFLKDRARQNIRHHGRLVRSPKEAEALLNRFYAIVVATAGAEEKQ